MCFAQRRKDILEGMSQKTACIQPIPLEKTIDRSVFRDNPFSKERKRA